MDADGYGQPQDDSNNLFASMPVMPASLDFDLNTWSTTRKSPPGTNIVQHTPLAPLLASNAFPAGTATMVPMTFIDPAAEDRRRTSVGSKSSQAHYTDGTGATGEGEPQPAWTDMKTKAGKDRKRLPLACIACRRKKIRCSGEKPACKHCMKSRTPCVYKVTTRKAAPRTDYMAMLDKRLKRMEERVIKALPKEDLERLPEVTRAVLKPGSAIQQQKAAKKRSAEDAFGHGLGRWANTPELVTPNPEARDPIVTAGDGREARAAFPPPKKTTKEERSALLTDGLEALPAKEIQLHLAEVYFDFVYGQSYHLLHKPSFMRRLEAGTIPPVLTLAVCAVSARFSTHPAVQTEPAFLRGEEWATAALEVALKRFDSPNITILIVLLLLGLHTFGACQGGRSWMLGGMAQRMAYALQLHVDLDHDPLGQVQGQVAELSFTDREIRRRTMWAAFMMDRFNSSGTERPLFATEAGLYLQLPIKENMFQMEIPGPTEQLDGTVSKSVRSVAGQMMDAKENMGVAAYITRLVWLWGRLGQYLNLGGKEKDKYRPWEPQSQYQVLLKHIEQWNNDLPESLHYNQENLRTHASEQTANQFIYMHLIYQQCILFSNRHAYPTTARDSTAGVPQEKMSQARKLAHESATRIAELIRDSTEHRLVAPFAGYCTYSSSAVLIYGAFSKNPQLEATCKENLTHNIKYLSKMKRHWGMFHFMTESLKDLYRQNADALSRGTNTPTSVKPGQKKVFQYGDWYNTYPNGVSQADYEEPEAAVKKEAGEDAVFSQAPDLQSVEDFFTTLSPVSKAKHPSKLPGRRGAKKNFDLSDVHGPDDPNLDPSLDPGMDSLAVPNSPYGIRESYSRTPVQARLPPLPLPQAQIPPQPAPVSSQQYQPQPQLQQQIPQQPDPTTLDPSILDPNLDPFAFAPPFTFAPNPGMLSQMDRHLVLQSYAGFDPATTAAASNSLPPLPNSNQNTDFWNLGDPNDFYMQDPGLGMGMNQMGMMGGPWMMPFNLDPPDFGTGSGQADFAGFGLGGPHDAWFGLGMDDVGQVDGGLIGDGQGQGQIQAQGQAQHAQSGQGSGAGGG